MPSLLASHVGAFTDSYTYVGTVTIAAASPDARRQVGLKLAYYVGDLTGATITFSAGGSPDLPVVSPATVTFDATTIYRMSTDAANPITYTITLATPASSPMALSAKAARGRQLTGFFTARGTLQTEDSITITTPGDWATGDPVVIIIGATTAASVGEPTVPAGFTLIASANCYQSGPWWQRLRVYTKPHAGESSYTYSVPGGWYHGGYFAEYEWTDLCYAFRDVSSPSATTTAATGDNNGAARTFPTAPISPEFFTFWYDQAYNGISGSTSRFGWETLATGAALDFGHRSSAVGPIIAAPTKSASAATSVAIGMATTVDELLSSDIPITSPGIHRGFHMGTGRGIARG